MTAAKTDPLAAATLRERPAAAGEPARPGVLAIGTLVAGRYRVLELVGEGGMGVVYRARDITLDADVALKRLHEDVAHDAERLAFFRNEVRVARRVTHPNVCRLHDLAEDGERGGWFVTMEYVAGESLASRIARGGDAWTLDDKLRVLRGIATGLAAAHDAGVVHRDLKPANVLLGGDRVVVCDFGIAGDRAALASGPQHVAGTDGYMAPEQARGAAVDARADVYAFGVVAAEVMGCRDVEAVRGGAAHVEPEALGELVVRCLAVDATTRPIDGRAIARELGDIARASGAIEPGDSAYVVPATRRRSPRHGRRLALGLAVAAALAGGATIAVVAAGGRGDDAGAGAIALAPIDVSQLPDDERWLGDAIAHLIVAELDDAYEITGTWTPDGAAAPAGALALRLARTPAGELHLIGPGIDVLGGSHEVAVAAAHALAGDAGPSSPELVAAGTTDVEAWRQWRRAQRDALLQRWSAVVSRTDDALRRDPTFALGAVESAFAFDRGDSRGVGGLADAQRLVDAKRIGTPWREALAGARLIVRGDFAAAHDAIAGLAAEPLSHRDRAYLDARWAFAIYFSGEHAAALPALESLVDRDRDEPAAPKLLADYYVHSDEPTAAAHALADATRAVALAPDDVGARVDLAIAYALAGRIAGARAIDRELAAAPPDDKRDARDRLFTLHVVLGDLAAAETDARRELAGTRMQRSDGLRHVALVDLYWGRFDAGLSGLDASAASKAALGFDDGAALDRLQAGRQAMRLGRRADAVASFGAAASKRSSWQALAAVYEALARGDRTRARALVAAVATGTPRATAELAIAVDAGDDAVIVAAHARLQAVSTSIVYLYDLALALERLGRHDEAVAAFERLAHHPQAWTEPIAATLAWYRLGLARAASGDAAGARAAFTEVVRRWGAATAPVPELADARARLRADHR
nr:serine/threonine-protein kinase [Kofleriaceae bacterium]